MRNINITDYIRRFLKIDDVRIKALVERELSRRDAKILYDAAAKKEQLPFRSKFMRDLLPYSNYAYGLFHAAELARRLGIKKIAAIEFGVAGGNGLLAMESHAKKVEDLSGIIIDIFGFDTGEGLTSPQDYRDMPYRFKSGNYKMDIPALRARLKKSKLILGDIHETAENFFEKFQPAPIGFASFDMDYYSSTLGCLSLFADGSPDQFFLPRCHFYFDDINGNEISSYNEFVGELAAISDFNEDNKRVKIAESRALRSKMAKLPWSSQMYVMHRFDHQLYNRYVSGASPASLSLREHSE